MTTTTKYKIGDLVTIIEDQLKKMASSIMRYKNLDSNFYDWRKELKNNSLRDTNAGALIRNFDIEKFLDEAASDFKEEDFFKLLKSMYIPKNKFNIGDSVDFVNDYGVVFKDHTITNFALYEFGGYIYDSDKNDSPWCWKQEKNLHLAGTYKKESMNLILNNGSIAKYKEVNFWGNKVYEIDRLLRTAVMVDGRLHTINSEDEPIEPLSDEWQAKELVRCNNCIWQGEEDELDDCEEDGEPIKGCPECKTDSYLMDVKG